MKDEQIPFSECAKHVSFETLIDGERYRMTVKNLLVSFEANRLRWERGELHGQLSVAVDLNGVHALDGMADVSSMNFSRLPDRHKRGADLKRLTGTESYPWEDMVQRFALLLLKACQEGDPALDLRDVPADTAAHTSENVLGIPVLTMDPMMVVAKGGEGKSLLVLYLLGELARRGYNVGCIDSEWNEIVHADRLRKLFGHDRPSVKYLRLSRSLVLEADRARRFVSDFKLDFVAIDSVGMSSEGAMEYSEGPNQYMRVVRSFGRVGSILVSHTKHEAADGSHKRPYGNAFWVNNCRAVWFLKSAQVSPKQYEVALEQVKTNGRHTGPVALRFEFGDEHIAIESIETADLVELCGAFPVRERIIATLKRRGPMTIAELAEELDVKHDAVKKALNRGAKQAFTKVTSSDGKITKFGLLERRSA